MGVVVVSRTRQRAMVGLQHLRADDLCDPL